MNREYLEQLEKASFIDENGLRVILMSDARELFSKYVTVPDENIDKRIEELEDRSK